MALEPQLPREPFFDARRTAPERKRALALAVATHVAQGARLESQGDYQAVVARGLRLNNNHGLTLTGGETRALIAVDDNGNVSTSKM